MVFASILYPADLNVTPIEITCAIFLSGTLETWWSVRDEDHDHVELITLDYNCTGFGQEDLVYIYTANFYPTCRAY